MKRFIALIVILASFVVAFAQPQQGLTKGVADRSYSPFRGNGCIALKCFAPMQTAVTATSISSGSTGITFRTRHEVISSGGEEGVRLTYSNFTSAAVGDGSISEASPNNTITVKVAMEYWESGSLVGTYPVFFNGQRSITIDINGSAVSDIVPCPVIRGGVIFDRVYASVAATGNYLPLTVNSRQSSTVTYNRSGESEGRITGDHCDDGSTITVGNVLTYAASAITGVSGRTKSLGVFGDSIAWGQAGALDEFGFIMRRAYIDGVGVINLARGSDRIHNLVTQTYNFRRLQLALQSCAAFYTNLGTNDLNGSRTAIQVAGELNTWHTRLRRLGRPSYQSTILPRNTSSDSFTTYAGQTKPAWEAERILLNDWMRGVQNSVYASVGAPTFSGYVEAGAYLETDVNGVLTQNGGYWLVNTTPQYTGSATTTATGTTLTDTNGNYTFGWSTSTGLCTGTCGMYIKFTSGANSGTVKQITNAPTSTTLTFTGSLTITTGDTYQILYIYTNDGTHPSDSGHDKEAQAFPNITGWVTALLGMNITPNGAAYSI